MCFCGSRIGNIFFGKGPDGVILALQAIQSLSILAIDNAKQMSGCVPIKLYLNAEI